MGIIIDNSDKEKKSRTLTPVTATKTLVDIFYQVQTEEDGWLPVVENFNTFAGSIGHAIIGIAMKVSVGTIKYRVHISGGSWLPFVTGFNIRDFKNGFAGNGYYVDLVETYYLTPETMAEKEGFQKAKYRVSLLGKEYFPWQYDDDILNNQDGYAGVFGAPIDRFQIGIE